MAVVLKSVGFSNAKSLDAEGQDSDDNGQGNSGTVGACSLHDGSREKKRSVTMQPTVGDEVVTNMVTARQINDAALAL